jgi:transketolase
MILICGHAGLKTGEDGPTHADPQPLQLLQENFPLGSMITLTPWEPNEIWPLMSAALSKRPSVIAPFVTRPNEKVVNRAALKLAPAEAAVTGVYKLRAGNDVTVVLQESGVTYAFITGALPRLLDAGIDVEVFYVASAELFDLLAIEQQNAIFSPEAGFRAIGITGFTLPTMYRWITSARGRVMTMHPFMHGRYPGSGPGRAVIAEAGLDGEAQFNRIVKFVETNACL